jgi:hypothetical protein
VKYQPQPPPRGLAGAQHRTLYGIALIAGLEQFEATRPLAADFKTLNDALIALLLRDDEDYECQMTRLVRLFDAERFAEASDALVAFRRRVTGAREAYRVYAGNLL